MKAFNFIRKKAEYMKFLRMNFTKALAAALLICVTFSIMYSSPPFHRAEDFPESSVQKMEDFPEILVSYKGSARNNTLLDTGSKDIPHRKKRVEEDILLGGLLASGFDRKQCLSRYQSVLYRKPSPHKPSPYLISKLRNYEKLHAQCGPGTKSYNKTIKLLKSKKIHEATNCKYVVSLAYSGLGNNILTISSAFLYALLTNRIMLVYPGNEIGNLFCEPFHGTSWLLPDDFPVVRKLWGFDQRSPECFWNVLNNNTTKFSAHAPPPLMYIHLVHDYDYNNRLFLCDQYQSSVQKVPWLIMDSDNYFVPSFFLMKSFEQELSKMFPDKETVFHHLGRYLFHPANNVWGLITRYYDTYLASADEIIGIQVRTFITGDDVDQYVIDQILACAFKEKLLPEVNMKEFGATHSESKKSAAVLMTSLSSNYSDNLSDMYMLHPTVDGAKVAVYQPSHEEFQKFGESLHEVKAWSEMYLLSVCDTLITSSWSTFGYIAQGLGGLNPWILHMPTQNVTIPGPACRKAMSMEPCFHSPPHLDCETKVRMDTAALIPYIKHCEDMLWGLKLVNS